MIREDIGDIESEKPEKSEVSSTRSTENFKVQGNLSSPGFDVHWDGVDTSVSEDWHIEKTAETFESPGIWDPNAFEQQAPSSWKQAKEPKRIQDISSPLLVEPEPDKLRSNSDEEEWPFKSPCKMEEKKKKKRMTPKKDSGASSDIESEDENPLMTANGDKGDVVPKTISRTVSDDPDEDEDIDDDPDDESQSESKKKEKHRSNSQGSKSSKESSRRSSKKKDQEPSLPRRGRGRPDADDEDDESPSKPARARRGSTRDSEGGEDLEVDSAGRPKKPKRKGTKSEVVGDGDGDEDEDLPSGSFHKLAKDADKKRSTSKSRKSSKAPGSASSGRRRRVKDKSMDASSHSAEDDSVDEFGEEEHEIQLKDDEGTPGGGRPGWRERREKNLTAPGSGGRRPPSSRRAQMRRASSERSSERWNRAVEGVDDEEDEEDPNKDMSRSAHQVKRYNSGGMTRMSAGLGTASYHGMEGGGAGRHRTPNRRPPRKAMQTPNSDNSGESFGGDDYEYEMNLSGRSARTLESIDDLEDFEHIDFQTPGMVNYDDEVIELMKKANPEYTAHLERRVNRKRDAVNYDQNMPMMTRQALMTRTASTQVQRQFVDQSGIDRRRLMVRSMSNSSMGGASADELSMSQHRQQFARPAPSRRPPPRTRSSGMAALSRSEHPQPSQDPRRGVYRTKSGASTSTFRQNQKPNRVLSVPRRPDGVEVTSRKGPPEDRKGNIARAQSMHAAVGRRVSPKKPERRVPKTIDKPARELPREKEDEKDDNSSVSEDSDVESEDEMVTKSPPKPRRKIPIKKVTPTVPRKKTDKRDFTVKRNRAKLHSMIYESKMLVDMDELLKQVQQGEVQRSPIKTLLMPSP